MNMNQDTITSIYALVIIGSIFVPIASLFIMNKLNSIKKPEVKIDLSSVET